MIDLTGRQFTRLKVLGRTENISNAVQPCWLCVCICGTRTVVRGQHLRNGAIKSCGCWSKDMTRARNTTHGGHGTGAYRSWQAMIARCENPNASNYYKYGAVGIRITPRWRNSFAAFLADMGERPPGMSLDRIDGSKGYYKANCRWATPKQQANNRRPRRTARPRIRRDLSRPVIRPRLIRDNRPRIVREAA